jgi:hypothetical protein
MDAQDIDTFGVPSGGGIVNCQVGVGAWEKFVEHGPPFKSITWRSAEGTQTASSGVDDSLKTTESVGTASGSSSGQSIDAIVKDNPLDDDGGNEGWSPLHRV